MCGILGIYSKNYSTENLRILFKCLKSLQHRGKDGYGIGFINKNKKFNLIKSYANYSKII